MVTIRCLTLALLTAAGAAQSQAQDAAPYGGGSMASRPSGPSGPSTPSLPSEGEMDASGNIRPERGPAAREAGAAGRRGPSTQLLGAGTFGTPGTGLENVLNSGGPGYGESRRGARKVCPPELEYRDNACLAPASSIMKP